MEEEEKEKGFFFCLVVGRRGEQKWVIELGPAVVVNHETAGKKGQVVPTH